MHALSYILAWKSHAETQEFCLRLPGVLHNTTKISLKYSFTEKDKGLSELHILVSMEQINMDSKAHGLE